MKNIILLISSLFFLQQIYGQYTQVPDPNFEQALIDLGIDSEGVLDGQFLTVDALGVIVLDVRYKNINNLTGLEAFVDLHDLLASNNNLTTIDLSVLPSTMWTIRLSNNNLSSIDLTPLSNVVNLFLSGNNFTTLSVTNLPNLFSLGVSNLPLITTLNIDNCSNLYALEFANSSIETIDLSNIPNLGFVQCQESQIQSLDFSNNQNLVELYASNSPLSSINLPNNPNLEFLDVDACHLTELDITNCPNLIDLECYGNLLINIDFTSNTLLEDVNCGNNLLTSLDLSYNQNLFRFWAPNNQIIGNIDFYGNPVLEEVWLDNNLFITLDLSQNNILAQVSSRDNSNLEMVNIKNGNNENIFSLAVFECPNLSCVIVDDPLADNDFILIEQNANINVVGNPEDCNLSINDNELQQIINVYPNPVIDILHIENNENIGIDKITVYNILGKVVLIEKINFNQLNLSNLNSGILFIKIETERGIITKKIIKK